MASSMMHYAIFNALCRCGTFTDRNRFLLGSILPDAALSRNSHRKISVLGGTKKTYDLSGFRSQYAEQMKQDEGVCNQTPFFFLTGKQNPKNRSNSSMETPTEIHRVVENSWAVRLSVCWDR